MLNIKIYLMITFAKFLYGFSRVSTMVIYGQAIHETGRFSSDIFKENKNLFGTKMPRIRKTYGQGSKRGHAYYKSHWDSIRDYFERQKYFKVDSSNDEAFIESTFKTGYAEDKQYITRWKNVIATSKKPIGNIYLYLLFFFLLGFVLVTSKKSNNSNKLK